MIDGWRPHDSRPRASVKPPVATMATHVDDGDNDDDDDVDNDFFYPHYLETSNNRAPACD